MTRPKALATRARFIVPNTASIAGPAQGLLPAASACEEGGFDFNLGYLGAPDVTIILRVGRPPDDEPRVAEGDIVVADRRVRPGDGSLVIATVGGQTVVRRFSTSEGLELPCVPDVPRERMEPVEILATVVSVIPITPE